MSCTNQNEMGKPHLVVVCNVDYANVWTKFADAYNKQSGTAFGINVVCNKPHPFEYDIPHQFDWSVSDPATKQTIESWVSTASAFIICDEAWNQDGDWFSVLNIPKTKPTAVFHCNDIPLNTVDPQFNFQIVVPEIEFRSARQKPMLMIPGCPMCVAHNVDGIIRRRRRNPKIIISHANSHTWSNRKGTKIIEAQLELLQKKYPNRFEFRNVVKGKLLPHKDIIASKIDTDIFIDQFNNEVGGFGTSTVESLEQGCIVLCTVNNLTKHFWEQFPTFPVVDISGSENQIAAKVEELILLGKEKLCDRMEQVVRVCRRDFGTAFIENIEKDVLIPIACHNVK